MLASELRQLYIRFFTEKGHLHLPGAPLIPIDALGVADTSTLFTSAGMQQFKPYFTGEAVPPGPRVVTVQKCMRTGDIGSVGDFTHCTFFEMLGNFSFGDYFKAEVIPWTWEFLTGLLKLDADRICVTVYYEDEEAYGVWRDVVGLPADRIHRLGEDKNYWPANAISEGPNGPCGPCSEVFYRVAPLEEMNADPALTPTQRYLLDDSAGRYVEIWNNVFTQYNRGLDSDGRPILTPLPKRNNDTGAGFDRIAYVVQGKQSVFETDLFGPILKRVEELSGKVYGGSSNPVDFAFRVVAEHTRSTVFCIADGVLPSNEGRGSVLRRLMRRAIRFGNSVLGFAEPFLHEVAPRVIEQMGDFYPELEERRGLILSTILLEEERFRQTLENGLQRLGALLEDPVVIAARVVPGGKGGAFTLYDTYGFPLELTQEIAEEQGLAVDLEAFGHAMLEHQGVSRGSADREVFRSLDHALSTIQRTQQATDFVGYSTTVCEATVSAIVSHGELVESARAGDEVEIVLNRTPFYAESGGQVGDTGTLVAMGGDTTCAVRARVEDTQKSAGVFLHRATILEGELSTGQRVTAAVDAERRRSIMRNHTATHLLHAALREVVGPHAHQKGSLVAPDRLRFDFTHTQPVHAEELRRVEELVNQRALDDAGIRTHVDVSIEEARSRGAMMLFGEKYGERVRMVEIPDVSLELCGGIHVTHTSQVGLFKILSESSVGSGVRRIEAVTGEAAYKHVTEREETIERLAAVLKSNPRDAVVAAERLVQQRSQMEKQIHQLKAGPAAAGEDLRLELVGTVNVVTGSIPSADGEMLAAVADRAAQERKSAVVVVASPLNGTVLFRAKVTPDLVKRGLHAGNIVREVARIAGGGGGGRPDFAQAGGKDPAMIPEALAAVRELVIKQTETA